MSCSVFSHDGTDSPPEANEVIVVLNNFKSKIIKVKVSLQTRGALKEVCLTSSGGET